MKGGIQMQTSPSAGRYLGQLSNKSAAEWILLILTVNSAVLKEKFFTLCSHNPKMFFSGILKKHFLCVLQQPAKF